MAVYIRGLSGEREVQVDEGTTLGDLRAAGLITDGLAVRYNGENANDDTVIENESVLVTTAPNAKHGRR